ncbi:MAG: PhoH family protein [Candidatus Cloacimonetes bacterium]|nr:PhoH family protein [Candidatus Cloacimonadota bacterium]
MNGNIYVLDTNVLIHNPQAMFSYKDAHVVIPITVIEEIDNFKKGLDEKGRNARQIGRYLDQLRKEGSLREGVKTPKGGKIQVVLHNDVAKITEKFLTRDVNDNLIIGTAIYIKEQEENKGKKIYLISKDANVRIKADAVGLLADNYDEDKVDFETLYTGYEEKIIPEKEFKNYTEKEYLLNNFGELNPNQFVVLINEENDSERVMTRFSHENNSLYPLKYYQNEEIFGIKARNDEQKMAFDLLLDPNVKLVSLLGIAGTGKTLIALAAGLEQVVGKEKNYSKLVVSRPISPVGKDLGFLPGSKADKFNPWMQPIYDNMEILLSHSNDDVGAKNGKIFGKRKPSLNDYLDYDFIELEPLTYIRGRSLPNQFMIIDEAQNLTPHEMKTIITRAGEGTKVVLTGDPFQIDIPYLDSESNGLSIAVDKLKKVSIVGHITLAQGERSELANIAAKFF